MSILPAWPLLFITGAFAILALSVLLRSFYDVALPVGITQRLSGSRSVVQWSITATLLAILAGVIETAGPTAQAQAMEYLQSIAPPGRPMAATGLVAIAAGLLVACRALVLMQGRMFRRAHASSGPVGVPTDGGFVQAGSFALRGFTAGDRLMSKPGGGTPVAILGVILAGYGFELLTRLDLCL
jgi:hypothetical protein